MRWGRGGIATGGFGFATATATAALPPVTLARAVDGAGAGFDARASGGVVDFAADLGAAAVRADETGLAEAAPLAAVAGLRAGALALRPGADFAFAAGLAPTAGRAFETGAALRAGVFDFTALRVFAAGRVLAAGLDFAAAFFAFAGAADLAGFFAPFELAAFFGVGRFATRRVPFRLHRPRRGGEQTLADADGAVSTPGCPRAAACYSLRPPMRQQRASA